MKLFFPMEPVSEEQPFDHPNYAYQVKWDGVRTLAYYELGRLTLANRKKKPRTKQYPELQMLKTLIRADSCILDGEMVAFGSENRPYFPAVLKRDLATVVTEQLVRRIPVVYVIFDIVYLNGKWLAETPFKERHRILTTVVTPRENVNLSENYPSGLKLFSAVQKQNMEGIVAKQLDSYYYFGRKHHSWKKIKNWRKLTGTVGGVTLRQGQVNALLLGIWQGGKLHYVGRAAAGLTREQRVLMTDWARRSAIEQPLFTDAPQVTGASVRWLPPTLTATVRYLEWTSRGTMRSPTILQLGTIP